MEIDYNANQWGEGWNDKPKKMLAFILLWIILAVGTVFLVYATNRCINCGNNNVSTNACNEAFDNGVNCGVNALMFYVKQGKKEIDVNAVRNKAQELRKK